MDPLQSNLRISCTLINRRVTQLKETQPVPKTGLTQLIKQWHIPVGLPKFDLPIENTDPNQRPYQQRLFTRCSLRFA